MVVAMFPLTLRRLAKYLCSFVFLPVTMFIVFRLVERLKWGSSAVLLTDVTSYDFTAIVNPLCKPALDFRFPDSTVRKACKLGYPPLVDMVLFLSTTGIAAFLIH